MKTPTHDEIARQARSLWTKRGCPSGSDAEIWLEAERQLTEDRNDETFTDRAKAETAAESMVEYHLSPAVSEEEAIKSAMPKQDARMRQAPRQTDNPRPVGFPPV